MSYTGKWIQIDLSTGKHSIQKTDKKLLKKYIGGKGLGFAILDKIAPDPGPLSDENPLIFVNGPFTGTKIQTSARTTLVSKSPLTNSIHDSHCGGNFGPALKRSGYDYLVISGKSDKPVYIYLSDKKVEIKDASNLWGKGIFFTNDELIKNNPGNNPRIATIGQAGENLSKIACIGVDKHRQFGRGGLGAVMGSKMLKAVVVDGSYKAEYHNNAKFEEINKQFTKDILNNEGVKFRRVKGTMKCVRSGQENSYLPTRNFQKGVYEDFEGISSETARKELNWEDTGCFNCAIRCSKWARWDNHELEGPEYETTAFLGSGCEISDIKDVTWANEICNDLGLDTISTGVTCSFAMECYEKGYLENSSGLELEWGNAVAQREFIKLIAERKGIGEIFADGTRIASEKIGKDSKDFAINIFGMEISGVNPLGSLTMCVSLSVADFASHTRLWCTESEMGEDFKIEDIPHTVIVGQNEINARNSLVICDFVPLGLDRIAPLLSAATGIEFSEKSLRQVGERISNLARRYNIRNGRKCSDDIVPERFFKLTAPAGFMKDKVLDKELFNELVQKVYELRGWNKLGEPTVDTLRKYEID